MKKTLAVSVAALALTVPAAISTTITAHAAGCLLYTSDAADE